MHYIALQMLFGDRGKYWAMIVGLTFASLIMTQQPAIYLGLMARTHSYISNMTQPDIWVMDPTVEFVEENKPLRDTDLQRVRGMEGVEWAMPLHKSLAVALLPDGSRKELEVSGIDDATFVGAPSVLLEGTVDSLRQQDAIILDQVAAEERLAYTGPDGKRTPIKVGDVLELNDHRAVVVGIAKMDRTFTMMPMAFTTYSRAVDYGSVQRRTLSYILVKAKEGFDKQAIIDNVKAELRLAAMTVEDFKKMNQKYWADNTGIPINFGIAVLLGFFVGAAIAGQTFYNFVHENLKQFGALKAMGVKNKTLLHMVLLQASVVGVIGYGLGVGISSIFGNIVHDSELAFKMPLGLLLFSASGITLIIITSTLLALRTVFMLDPATVFRN
jgi:putative ABC transport system permease protein